MIKLKFFLMILTFSLIEQRSVLRPFKIFDSKFFSEIISKKITSNNTHSNVTNLPSNMNNSTLDSNNSTRLLKFINGSNTTNISKTASKPINKPTNNEIIKNLKHDIEIYSKLVNGKSIF